MAQYALDDAVGIPVGVCVTLSSELNADCIGYLFGLSSVIPKTVSKTCEVKFPLHSLARVTMDNVSIMHSAPILILMPRFRAL